MKNQHAALKKRWKVIGNEHPLIKHKKISFQVAVTALLAGAILFITWYLIKILH